MKNAVLCVIIKLMEVISQEEIEDILNGASKVRKLSTLGSEIRHDLRKLKGQVAAPKSAESQAIDDCLLGLIQEIDATMSGETTVIDGREL